MFGLVAYIQYPCSPANLPDLLRQTVGRRRGLNATTPDPPRASMPAAGRTHLESAWRDLSGLLPGWPQRSADGRAPLAWKPGPRGRPQPGTSGLPAPSHLAVQSYSVHTEVRAGFTHYSSPKRTRRG
jgi:hypothetical protein